VTVAASQAAFDQLFINQYGAAPAGAGLQTIYGFNDDGSLFTTGTGAANSVYNFRGDSSADTFNPNQYTYNFAPPNYLQLPLERKSGFGRVSFELSPAAELYGQLIYATYDANTQLAPTPASSLFIPVTNPFVPDDLAFLAASRSNPDANLSLVKRVTEIGPRFENNEYEVYQFVGGVRGDITSNWSYDVYGAYGETTIDNTQLGNVSRTKFEELTFSPDGGVAQCGGLNPFGLGSISQECAAYVSVDALNTYEIKQTVFEGTITGNLFDLPAGPVGSAFGVFYKEDKYEFIADEALRASTPDGRPDIAGFNASDNTVGKTDSTEFFAEILVPIVRDVPFIQSLDLTAGYRYADYSTAGGVNSYKGELSWAPVDALRFRGSYQRAVRAPSIVELFQPQVTNFPSITEDPCNITSAARTSGNAAAARDLCLAQGLPADLIDAYNNPNDQAEGLSGGNPDLFEETADTYSIGFVFQSPSSGIFADFQASVDYYDISIEDAIDAVTAETFVDRCFNPAFNPGFELDNFYCNFFGRNTSTGEITDALELQSNIGAIETSGVDLQLDWRFDAGPGQLSFNWIATYLDKFERQELPGDVFESYEGTIGTNIANAFPEWKWAFNVGYNWSGLGVNARWRYVDSMVDETYDGSSAALPKFSIPSVSYYDLTAYYSFSGGFADGLTLRAGVVNLTDEEPEIYPSYIQANTDPSTYDVLGRRYFINLNYAF
jgi:iron complex outermembrane receptor protein